MIVVLMALLLNDNSISFGNSQLVQWQWDFGDGKTSPNKTRCTSLMIMAATMYNCVASTMSVALPTP